MPHPGQEQQSLQIGGHGKERILSDCVHRSQTGHPSVLRIRIRDPVPFRSRDSGWVKNQDLDPVSRSGMNIPDHISEKLETIFGLNILQFFDADYMLAY
jgi:hypothetical protein